MLICWWEAGMCAVCDKVVGDIRQDVSYKYSGKLNNILAICKTSEMGGACSTHRSMKNPYNILVRKYETKCQLRRPGIRWEYNIKMDIRGFGYGCV
jgi:hypothetical protein